MYTLIDTVARSFQSDVGVYKISSGDLPIRTLVSTHKEVFFVLTHPLLNGPHTLNASDVSELIFTAPITQTVNQWLVSIGNLTLPLTRGSVKVTEARAVMNCAYAAGFTVKNSTGSFGADTGDLIVEDLPHLALTNVKVDYREMQRNVLATVGGYLHRTDANEHAFYILDGATTQKICKSPKLNLISLDNIAPVNIIPFTQCQLIPAEGNFLKDGVVVTTPVPLTNKTVWLSLGGHLMCLSKDYWVVNDRALYIKWSEFNFIKKYMSSKKHIDLSTVNVAMGIENGSVVDQDVLNSNLAITAYLHLSQSFIMVIDDVSISVIAERLENTGLPGKYYAYHYPHSPVLTSDGRIPSLSWFNETKAWVLSTSVEAGMTDNFLGDVMYPLDTPLYTQTLQNARPHKRASLYQLHVTTSKLSIAVG